MTRQKIKLSVAIALFAIFFLMLGQNVFAQENIASFAVDINVNPDSSLDITETIIYNFGSEFRHGIYRDIPYKYKTSSGNQTISIKVQGVYDEIGQKYQHEVSTSGGMVRIKIGNPESMVNGIHTYKIVYRVLRAINYFSDHDELYWNVTGNAWNIDITLVSAKITLPAGIAPANIRTSCYVGYTESGTPCLSQQVDARGEVAPSTTFFHPQLRAQEGLTIVVGLPKGALAQPSKLEVIWQNVKDNLVLFLPVVVFVAMIILWRKKGRDPAGTGTIIAQYEPPEGLSAAEVGTVVDEKVQSKDIVAAIIDLAVGGYLKINKITRPSLFGKKDDWQLEQLKDSSRLQNYEKYLADRLFSYDQAAGETGDSVRAGVNHHIVMLSRLKNKFYKDLKEIEKKLYSDLVTKEYFPKSPLRVRQIYFAIGMVVLFLSFWLNNFFSLYTFLGLLISGAIVFVFGFFMPVRTQKGVTAREHILGLKEYLSVAEKDRLAFHNAPEKTPERFEKLLPYAIALGVEEQWAKQFEGLYNQSPSWYHDPAASTFHSWVLINSLHNFSSAAKANLGTGQSTAAAGGSGLGGGGFSGGGFGGGGGGSW